MEHPFVTYVYTHISDETPLILHEQPQFSRRSHVQHSWKAIIHVHASIGRIGVISDNRISVKFVIVPEWIPWDVRMKTFLVPKTIPWDARMKTFLVAGKHYCISKHLTRWKGLIFPFRNVHHLQRRHWIVLLLR